MPIDVGHFAGWTRWLRGCLVVGIVSSPRLGAQRVEVVTPPLLGGEDEERARLMQLTGAAPDGVMLRSLSRSLPWAPGAGVRLRVLGPDLQFVLNSALPVTRNDGPLRASRGVNSIATVGVELRAGPARLILAPQLVREQNLPFQVVPFPQDVVPGRSVWANPFHPLPESIDLPLRFGDSAHRRIDAGQSSLTVRVGPYELGAATENLWWGPGIRNAIVLSNGAAGFPHLVARTHRPMGGRLGRLDVELLAGRLHESPYFDRDASNDRRGVSAGALVWRPALDTALTVGVSRLRIDGTRGHDQVSSLFGRWVLPVSHFEAYGEWARFQDPSSLRDFLEFPHHSEGYTLGLQWAKPLARERIVRLQAEVTYLEPSSSIRSRVVRTSYTSEAVPQGFTERGEVLGASIGPGSSSQWLAADVFAARWRVGVVAGRVRYDNGTLYEAIVPGFKLQDVSVSGGVRGSVQLSRVRVAMEFVDTARLNYLYQSYVADYRATTSGGIDIGNRSVSLTVSTAPSR